MNSPKIAAVNFHLWKPCNMTCRFCFSTYEDIVQSESAPSRLSKRDTLEIITKLADYGYKKITFVGGEPLLCPWIDDSIMLAKHLGMKTMIVSNGSKVDKAWLKSISKHLDWFSISIDSQFDAINLKHGRSINSKVIPIEKYVSMCRWARSFGIKVKVNTVVTINNYREDLSSVIREIKPNRWKIFQALKIYGQNDQYIDHLAIDNEQFGLFAKVNRNTSLERTQLVFEKNKMMKQSYVMIDPFGRFIDNSSDYYSYSRPILEVGIQSSLDDITLSPERFAERNGNYDW